MVAPDLVFEADETSRVEVRGFVSADEFRLKGRGTHGGMAISGAGDEFSASVRRPGHGRGAQTWPGIVSAGAEDVALLSFPSSGLDEATLTAMLSGSIE
jgi:hypothetical protein